TRARSQAIAMTMRSICMVATLGKLSLAPKSMVAGAAGLAQHRDLHNLAHNATPRDVADGVAWHVKHFSRLVAKLRDTPDVGGKSILDSAALVLLFEGGHGFDAEGGNPNSSHSSENMIALVAGR